MNQCIRLVESLTEFSKTRPVNEIKQATLGIVFVLGNIRMVYLFYFSKDFYTSSDSITNYREAGLYFLYNFWYPTACLKRKKRKIPLYLIESKMWVRILVRNPFATNSKYLFTFRILYAKRVSTEIIRQKFKIFF